MLTFNITPLPGPFLPMYDSMLAHAVCYGIATSMIEPLLQSWVINWIDTSAPGPGEAAQPASAGDAGHAEATAPPYPTHGVQGAAPPGDTTTTTTGPPHTSATPREPREEDDPMAGAAPPPETGPGSSV